jgi:hypothetical protein
MSRWPRHYRIGVALGGIIVVVFIGLLTTARNRHFRRWMASEPVSEEQLIRQLGGPDSVEAIRNPDRVEAVLLKPPDDKNSFDALAYKAVSDAVPVSNDVAASISRTLTTPHRQISGAKSCIVRYGVRVSFSAGPNRSDVYFCFECAILEIVFNGKSVGSMHFDVIYEQLITDALKIYPDHEGLAKLKEQWHE